MGFSENIVNLKNFMKHKKIELLKEFAMRRPISLEKIRSS